MKIDNDKLTNRNIKQPIGLTILGGVSIFLILVILNTMIPFPSEIYFFVSSVIGFLGFFSYIWIRVKPSLYARFFLNIGISGIFLIMAWRSFIYLFPQLTYLGVVLTTLLAVFAHTLPMWNSKLANQFRDELYAPKTKLSKILNKLSLLLFIFVPVIIGIFLRIKTESYIFIILFLVGLLISIIMPFSHRSQGSPWERNLPAKESE